MMLAAYMIPQMLYRRSDGKLLGPLVPVLRLMALLIRPVVGLLHFLHSLVELTDETGAGCGAAHVGGKHRRADYGGRGRRADAGGRPQADPVCGGVRRQGGAGGDDAAAGDCGARCGRHAGTSARSW